MFSFNKAANNMLSPSSLSSSTSLEGDNSCTSASFLAPSESSISNLLASPDMDFLLHHHSPISGFLHSNSTPLIGSGTYDEFDTHLSIPSTSDSAPLYVVNPCFQSAVFQQQNQHQNGGTSGASYNSSSHCALRPLQNIQPGPSLAQSPMMMPPKYTRRTTSLQIVRPVVEFDAGSVISTAPALSQSSNSKDSHISNGCKPKRFPLTNDKRFCIANQSASTMEWLNKTAFIQLKLLLEKHSSPDFSATRWYRKYATNNSLEQDEKRSTQMKLNLKDFLRQFRGKSQSMEGEPSPLNANINNLYGTPLGVIQANTADGSPLPQFVYDLMDYITGEADKAEGIFRKNGGKVKIQEIKDTCSRLSPSQHIPQQLLNDSQVYDLGDSLKAFFRELPECLFTERITKMLREIVKVLPEHLHFTALQYCLLLMPTENREALMTLLKFLKGIARHSANNLMTSQNLAACWNPSLLSKTVKTAPIEKNKVMKQRSRRKTIAAPNEKDLSAFRTIEKLLAKMIDNWERLACIPEVEPIRRQEGDESLRDKVAKRMEVCYDLDVPLKSAAKRRSIGEAVQFCFTEELHNSLKRDLSRLKQDYQEGWQFWHLQRVFPDGSQIYVRHINDQIGLKSFRIHTSVAASPNMILAAILNTRSSWDSNVVSCKKMGPSGQNFDIVRVLYRPTVGGPEKYSYLARRWTYNQLDLHSVCSLIERSIVPRGDRQTTPGNVAVCESKFLILPMCPGFSQLTYISRIDFKGKSPQWYDTVYGEMLVHQFGRLKAQLFRCRLNFAGTDV